MFQNNFGLNFYNKFFDKIKFEFVMKILYTQNSRFNNQIISKEYMYNINYTKNNLYNNSFLFTSQHS